MILNAYATKNVNFTNTDIYIEKVLYDKNVELLNMTWECESAESDNVIIQMNFTSPSEISPDIE